MADNNTPEYNADALEVLEGLEAVRKRPGMYIGSTDHRGLQHLVWEIVDNAVDEALAEHATHIEVTLNNDGSVTVVDDGRGIPVDTEKKTGMPGPVVVMTKLHAGGKFGGESSGYKTSGGLHGVGASVVNAMSERMDVEVRKHGKLHEVSFQRGKPGFFDSDGNFEPANDLKVSGKLKKSETGTTVRFWPDMQLFVEGSAVDFDQILSRARRTAFLVPGLELLVRDERGPEPVEEMFRFDGGVVDFAEYLTAGETLCDVIVAQGEDSYTETVPVLEGEQMVTKEVERTMEVDVALRWANDYDTTIQGCVNIVSTPKGGTHVSGFERALTRVVNEALRDHKILKASEESALKDDVQEGLVAVVTVRMPEPQFEGQTKEILGSPAAQSIVYSVTAETLRDWFAQSRNKTQARKVLKKIASAARARIAARSKRETLRRKQALESSSLPGKLADCRTNEVARAEILLVEGDSAMGTCKQARDSEFQALLPLRGKILNTQRATEKRMLSNKECAAIISAFGGGSGKSFDLEAMRYQRVIVLCDADVDGAHIRTLLLTLFYRYMRPMLEAGRVFSAVPPLHRVKVKNSGDVHYTYSDEELAELLAKLKKQGKEPKEVQRYKGLGEMDADQLAETTLDPAVRKLRRITVQDAEAMADVFDRLMGKSSSKRRNFIEARAADLDKNLIDA